MLYIQSHGQLTTEFAMESDIVAVFIANLDRQIKFRCNYTAATAIYLVTSARNILETFFLCSLKSFFLCVCEK